MNLYDMMQGAGGGEAFARLGRQYGLSDEQVRQAMEAFMPAFATSLRRSAADPTGFFGFLQTMADGRHAPYYADPERAVSAAGRNDGNAVLGQLFGSPEVSRAVAAQVHAATGIGEAVLKQMLPVIATMLAGGLFRQLQGGGNPFWDAILLQMGGGASGAPDAPGRGRGGPLDRLEEEERARDEDASRRSGGASPGDNPFGRMFEDMLRNAFPGAVPGSRAGDAGAGPGARAEPPRPGADMFGDMFEPGRRVSEAYQRNLEQVFDQFLRGMDRHR